MDGEPIQTPQHHRAPQPEKGVQYEKPQIQDWGTMWEMTRTETPTGGTDFNFRSRPSAFS